MELDSVAEKRGVWVSLVCDTNDVKWYKMVGWAGQAENLTTVLKLHGLSPSKVDPVLG